MITNNNNNNKIKCYLIHSCDYTYIFRKNHRLSVGWFVVDRTLDQSTSSSCK